MNLTLAIILILPVLTKSNPRSIPSFINPLKKWSKEGKDDSSKTLDANLVVTESNETESERHVSSSRSGKDTHAKDADVNSVNDKQPMAYTIPLKDMPQISLSIDLAPVSSIVEPGDSLIMGNEELSTIPEKESDEFIKSSVEDLIPIPRESEDTSGITPLSDSNEDEFFTPRDDIELLLHHDPSISIVSILEGFIDEPPLEENDDLFDLESKEND
ncbi:hypothetical protein Tco_1569144 [Tanacetum coccineum]